MGHHGADSVYVVDHPNLDEYTPSAYVQAFSELVHAINPDVLLIGHTAIGKDLAPRVAARLLSGLISDAVAVEEWRNCFHSSHLFRKSISKEKIDYPME